MPSTARKPGVAVVGVEAVALPRVVAEHDVGRSGGSSTPPRRAASRPDLELAVDVAEEHLTRRWPRAPWRRPAAPPGAVRRGRRCRRRGPSVPFEPSVQMRWWTTHPAAAHLASVAPQPNSTSSGWAPMASATAGVGQVQRTRRTRSVSDGGQVEVVRAGRRPSRGAASGRTRSGEARAARPRRGGGRRSPARRRTRSRTPVGTAITLVPSSWRSGTSVTPRRRRPHGEVGGQGQVGVGDDHPVDALGGERGRRPSATAPLSPRPGRHSTSAPRASAQAAHVVVVAHHDHRQGRRRRPPPGRPSTRASVGPLGRRRAPRPGAPWPARTP